VSILRVFGPRRSQWQWPWSSPVSEIWILVWVTTGLLHPPSLRHDSLSIYKELVQRPLRFRCSEFADTPVESPLDGLHERYEWNVTFGTSLIQLTSPEANATAIGQWPNNLLIGGGRNEYLRVRIANKKTAIRVTGRGCPCGCETSSLPHFLENRLTDGGELLSLTRRPPFTPRKTRYTHFC
jgi:hypothetical protein